LSGGCANEKLQTPIKWEPVDVTPQLKAGKTVIPEETIESIKQNKVALKGPLAVSWLIRVMRNTNSLRRPLERVMYH
jgi:isocitrate dehydrogenase